MPSILKENGAVKKRLSSIDMMTVVGVCDDEGPLNVSLRCWCMGTQ